ncbi:uncharacterized protein LOC121755694 isoform X2 [Salvia splendens]|uniref:uncharacterized protein LOC121755694 isoform X2 n=1 Tax=Salvia splendens TaxID=180675 RepID=UPI001C26D657|nr:uncharacterized protein LOC121755694 isoform X2 [Salvia splendens]
MYNLYLIAASHHEESHYLHSIPSITNTMFIPQQAVYLYYDNWTLEIDEIVLNMIIKLKRETQWKFDEFPSWFVLTVQHAVQTKTNILLTEVDIKQRLDFLKQRYTTFKEVVGYKGVSYDVEAKFVRVPDEIWVEIMKLACLYGMDDIKKEREVSVIVLSDCTEEIPTDESSCYEVSGFKAEVNSPGIVPPQTVRRKLFAADVAPQVDQESTNDMGMYFIDIGSDGSLVTRLETGRVLPKPDAAKTEQAGPSTRSPNASSVASNSPLRWWPHNIRRPNF